MFISSQFDKLRTPTLHDWVWPIVSGMSPSYTLFAKWIQQILKLHANQPIVCINTGSASKNDFVRHKLPQTVSVRGNFTGRNRHGLIHLDLESLAVANIQESLWVYMHTV